MTMRENDANGLLLLDKPAGITSFEALERVKRIINNKAGHAGTLDRFASGLLIALCGSYTRMFDRFQECDKEYEALMRFGISTDTGDPEGRIVARSSRTPTIDEIQDAIRSEFSGKVIQRPPKFSAIHINGKRAYDLARKGKGFDVPERTVEIKEFEILNYSYPYLKARIRVSKGCYIRSISYDLAKTLKIEGHTEALVRTAIGKYNLKNAVNPFDDRALVKSLIGA